MNPYCGVQKKLSNCADFTSNSAKKKRGEKCNFPGLSKYFWWVKSSFILHLFMSMLLQVWQRNSKGVTQQYRGAIDNLAVFFHYSIVINTILSDGGSKISPWVDFTESRKYFDPCLYTKLLSCLPCRGSWGNCCSLKRHCAQSRWFCSGCETMFCVFFFLFLVRVYCFVEVVNNPSTQSVLLFLLVKF